MKVLQIDPTCVTPGELAAAGGRCQFTTFKFDDHATLLWAPWNEAEWERPVFPVETAKYHPIIIHGHPVNQPRRTACYDHPYAYSGQVHPIEPETPAAVTALYGHVATLFPGERVNMCLANGYYHGYHCISAHGDNERQMNGMTNVYCFVVGATRRMVIRKKSNMNEILLDVMLPEGLYVMQGSNFQKIYTHEFPRMYYDFGKTFAPKLGGKMTSMEKADWCLTHQEEVRAHIRGLKKKVKTDSGLSLIEEFELWCQARFSFTLRYFG